MMILSSSLPVCAADGDASSSEETAQEPAHDITRRCRFRGQLSGYSLGAALDHGLFDAFYPLPGEEYIDIFLPEDARCGGVFMDFVKIPEYWAICRVTESGEEFLRAEGRGSDQYQQFADLGAYPVPEHLRLYADELALMEIRVYDDAGPMTGPLVRNWRERPEKAELMVVSTHPDDEVIFLGGVLPTYAGQGGKDTVVVYMSCAIRQRASELLNGLWTSGVRQYPVIGNFPDRKTHSLNEARTLWNDEDCQRYLVEQIRRYKPEVLVTQDTHGEYGHGAHQLTVYSVKRAIRLAQDPDAFPDLTEKYGTWEVKKVYLHLYPRGEIVMDWRQPLDFFGGKTALEVAQTAILEHQSQPRWHDRVVDTGPYANNRFGLFYSAVGPDEAGNDLFEHIPAS